MEGRSEYEQVDIETKVNISLDKSACDGVPLNNSHQVQAEVINVFPIIYPVKGCTISIATSNSPILKHNSSNSNQN